MEKLGEALPSQIWKIAREDHPTITLQDISFELYHGSRDPKRQIYEKVARGKYKLVKNRKGDVSKASKLK